MSKHTPGPWQIEYQRIVDCNPTLGRTFNKVIADVVQDNDEKVANLFLIAAAPELLKALKLCRDAVIRYSGAETSLYEVTMANEVINKAEGGSK